MLNLVNAFYTILHHVTSALIGFNFAFNPRVLYYFGVK